MTKNNNTKGIWTSIKMQSTTQWVELQRFAKYFRMGRSRLIYLMLLREYHSMRDIFELAENEPTLPDWISIEVLKDLKYKEKK